MTLKTNVFFKPSNREQAEEFIERVRAAGVAVNDYPGWERVSISLVIEDHDIAFAVTPFGDLSLISKSLAVTYGLCELHLSSVRAWYPLLSDKPQTGTVSVTQGHKVDSNGVALVRYDMVEILAKVEVGGSHVTIFRKLGDKTIDVDIDNTRFIFR